MLFLLDRAYNSASLWWRIDRVGGFFVTRLPASYKPTIRHGNRKHRGQSRKVERKKLREVLEGLQRNVLDVMCAFSVRVRPYRTDKGRRLTHPFRVVALKNRKTKKYHLYVTNIPANMLAAEDIATLYKLRWEVEISYKAGKSGCGLAELNSSKPHVVRTLVLAALLRQDAGHEVAGCCPRHALPPSAWINPLMWLAVFNAELMGLLAELSGVGRACGW